MATWKKVATIAGGQVEGNITGIAHNGLGRAVAIAEGGTNVDMSGFAQDSLLTFNGTGVTAIPKGSDDQILTTEGGAWTWKDVNDMHDHADTYLSLATGGTVEGSLAVTGTIYADVAVVSELQSITEAAGQSVVLNSGGSSSDGDDAGLFINAGGGAGTTIEADDPAILFEATAGRWQIGKYSSSMQNIAFADVTSTPTAGGSTNYAGTIACNGGDIFISV